jgi:hypothetical protein
MAAALFANCPVADPGLGDGHLLGQDRDADPQQMTVRTAIAGQVEYRVSGTLRSGRAVLVNPPWISPGT